MTIEREDGTFMAKGPCPTCTHDREMGQLVEAVNTIKDDIRFIKKKMDEISDINKSIKEKTDTHRVHIFALWSVFGSGLLAFFASMSKMISMH